MRVSPLDALRVINELNAQDAGNEPLVRVEVTVTVVDSLGEREGTGDDDVVGPLLSPTLEKLVSVQPTSERTATIVPAIDSDSDETSEERLRAVDSFFADKLGVELA